MWEIFLNFKSQKFHTALRFIKNCIMNHLILSMLERACSPVQMLYILEVYNV